MTNLIEVLTSKKDSSLVKEFKVENRGLDHHIQKEFTIKLNNAKRQVFRHFGTRITRFTEAPTVWTITANQSPNKHILKVDDYEVMLEFEKIEEEGWSIKAMFFFELGLK